MFIVCSLVTALASPQAGLSIQQSATFKDKYLAEGIARAHFKINEANLNSDIWLEISDFTDVKSRSQWNVLIQELTWQQERLKIGYQIHRWGQLDFLSSSDVVSPKDLRWGPLTPIELQRKANPSITGLFQTTNLQVQPAVHFGPAVSSVSISSNRWSLFPPDEMEESLQYFKSFEGAPLDELFWASMINSVDKQDSIPFTVTPSPDSKYPVDLTLKVSSTTAQRTIGGGMGWIRNRMPMVTLDPVVKNIVDSQRYPSVLTITQTIDMIEQPIRLVQPHTFVLSSWYSQLLGRFGVRLEGSHQNRVAVQNEIWSSEIAKITQGSAGIDTILMGRTSLSSEHRIQFVHQDVQPLWLIRKVTFESAFSSQSSFKQNRLLVKNALIYNWNFDELMGIGEIKWKFSDSWSVDLGGVLLTGQAPEDFNERIGYTGGQIGYFSDNDGLYVNANWIN